HRSGPVAHRLLVRGEPCLVMAAAVERDVDRVSKWSHLVVLPRCAPRVHRTVLRRLPAPFLIGAPIAPTQHRRGTNQTADRARDRFGDPYSGGCSLRRTAANRTPLWMRYQPAVGG